MPECQIECQNMSECMSNRMPYIYICQIEYQIEQCQRYNFTTKNVRVGITQSKVIFYASPLLQWKHHLSIYVFPHMPVFCTVNPGVLFYDCISNSLQSFFHSKSWPIHSNTLLRTHLFADWHPDLMVSINGVPPKWMVY